jgi:hypothetical protein
MPVLLYLFLGSIEVYIDIELDGRREILEAIAEKHVSRAF